jgi:hypothetical protein
VIFVAVCQPQRGALLRRIAEVLEIGSDEIGAERMVGEGDAAIDEQTMIVVLDRHAVHADFSQAAQCYQLNAICHGSCFERAV